MKFTPLKKVQAVLIAFLVIIVFNIPITKAYAGAGKSTSGSSTELKTATVGTTTVKLDQQVMIKDKDGKDVEKAKIQKIEADGENKYKIKAEALTGNPKKVYVLTLDSTGLHNP